MVLYQICVFGADLKSNMAARVHNVFGTITSQQSPLDNHLSTITSQQSPLNNHLSTITSIMMLTYKNNNVSFEGFLRKPQPATSH
jgi:hypothetical protein